MARVRVAVAQLATGTDVNENLETCLRVIDRAGAERPDLVVLPEFCNHLSWYDSKEHCYEVSVELESAFVRKLGEAARAIGSYLVVNCTVRREPGVATGTSILFDRDGRIRATSDKQVLMGHENEYLRRAGRPSPIVDTPIGRIAMYACMDGVINETPRALALGGAQILCNSLNSFAYDEASLHVPVRAPENRVFVVAANKVGPLIPEAVLEPISQAINIPAKFLHGAGESQIVAPDGTVLVKAPRQGEEVVVAEIEPARADDKRRPDGTDVFASRRPALYGAIAADPATQVVEGPRGAEAVEVMVVQPGGHGEEAVARAVEAVKEASAAGVKLVVLPELFCLPPGPLGDPTDAARRSDQAIEALAAACDPGTVVVTSLVHAVAGELAQAGLVIGAQGVLHAQAALHDSQRYPWSSHDDAVRCLQLPWGRLAVIPGDDALYPEAFRLATIAGAEVVAVPFAAQERWEVDTGLVERAAENRVCLVAATRPGDAGTSLVATLHEDFTLMTPWKERAFDGEINYPILSRAAPEEPGVLRATIHPARSHNKVVSPGTDVLAGRPWQLVESIVSPTAK